MHRPRWSLLVAACAGLCLGGIVPASLAPALAQSGDDFAIDGRTIGKSKESGEIGPARNFSGIACIEPSGFPRHCLLVDDEAQSAQFALLTEHALEMGPGVQLTSDRFDGKPSEFDGEGVAYGEGAFYVIGSHGHPRDAKHTEDREKDKPKFAAAIVTNSVIQRIPATASDFAPAQAAPLHPIAAVPTRALHKILKEQPELTDYVDQRLEKNGLTIEGVAVSGGRLYAGLRGPLLDDERRAAILAVDADALFAGKPAAPQLFQLKLGKKRGVRDLVAYEDGFLVLAGPSNDPKDTVPIAADDYSVFWWKPDGTLRALGDIAGLDLRNTSARDPEKTWAKPEALLPLDTRANRLRVLVLFDGASRGRTADIAAP